MAPNVLPFPFALAASLAAFTVVVTACGLASLGTGENLRADGGGGAGGGGNDGGSGVADGAALVDGAGGDGAALPDAMLPDGALVDPYYGRVTSGLVALYEIEEGKGSTLNDSMPTPYPLNIATLADVTWHPHSLELKNFTKIASSANFDKLFAACNGSNEITVETWVKYAAVEGDSQTYGRLLTLANSTGSRDLAVGNIGASKWWFAMASGDDAESNGSNTNLVHTVLVRTNDGNNTLHGFVNGAEVSSAQNTLKPNAFTPFALTVGNVPEGGRGVKATIHLIAFYSRALTIVEIGTNFMAGPDPSGP